MEKFMAWMEKSFAPKMNKLAHNPWMAALQQAILTAMPMIFIGSFVTLLTSFGSLIEGFPDFSPLNTFSMGILSIFLAYLVPFLLMEKKRHSKTKKEAGLAGIALFLIISGPTFDDAGNISFELAALGNGGMIAALMAGLFTGFVMNLFANHSFFKEDSAIPDFITVWFDTLIPILIILLFGWVFTFYLHINIFDVIYLVFSPVIGVSESFLSYTLFYWFEYTFLYTFGVSTWALYPIESAIRLNALAINTAAVAAGGVATMVNGGGNYWTLGGGGCTLALAFMMLFLSKSKKLKIIGKSTFVPSACNINEPLVFGAPIAFNPILMLPMWIVGLVGPALTWLVYHFGLVPCVSINWAFWYLPFPFGSFAVGGISGLIFAFVIFAISWLIYLPFFKVYDKECLEAEQEEEAKKAALAAKKAKRESTAAVVTE